MITPDLIARTAVETRRALTPLTDEDWSASVPGLDWSCWQVGVHLADALLAHAAQIVAQPSDDFLPIDLTVHDRATPASLLEVIDMTAGVLRSVFTLADPSARSWHPWGIADPVGSAAMGVTEALVHTRDIAAGLGSDWLPPADLCAPVIERLFPDAPHGDPSAVLLWCTGRAALPDRSLQTTWRWDVTVR